MPSENDPLSATIGPYKRSTAQTTATSYAKEQAVVLARSITHGNTSLRILALSGRIAMTITSAVGIWNHFLALHWISAIVKCYTFSLGLRVVALEARSSQFEILPRSLYRFLGKKDSEICLVFELCSGEGRGVFCAWDVAIVPGEFRSDCVML